MQLLRFSLLFRDYMAILKDLLQSIHGYMTLLVYGNNLYGYFELLYLVTGVIASTTLD